MSENREPEVIVKEVHSKLSQHREITRTYLQSIKSELRIVETDPEPYVSHMYMLYRQIENLEALERVLDTEVWPLVKSFGD